MNIRTLDYVLYCIVLYIAMHAGILDD